jgi:hypothetical protein
MATVLEILLKSSVLLCDVCEQNDPLRSIFIKKYFLFTVASVRRVRVEKLSQGRSKIADDARPGMEVAEITVKRLFRRTGKAMRQVYINVAKGYVEK